MRPRRKHCPGYPEDTLFCFKVIGFSARNYRVEMASTLLLKEANIYEMRLRNVADRIKRKIIDFLDPRNIIHCMGDSHTDVSIS